MCKEIIIIAEWELLLKTIEHKLIIISSISNYLKPYNYLKKKQSEGLIYDKSTQTNLTY